MTYIVNQKRFISRLKYLWSPCTVYNTECFDQWIMHTLERANARRCSARFACAGSRVINDRRVNDYVMIRFPAIRDSRLYVCAIPIYRAHTYICVPPLVARGISFFLLLEWRTWRPCPLIVGVDRRGLRLCRRAPHEPWFVSFLEQAFDLR